MRVLGGDYPTPNIAHLEISRKITFVSMCDITSHYKDIFFWCVSAIEKQVLSEGLLIESLPKVNAIVSSQRNITFELDQDAGGYRTNLLFYPLYFWLEKQWNDYSIMAAILEELCHHFWNIEDEALVKRKVVDIMNSHIFNSESQVTLGQVYNIDWIEEYEYRRDNGQDLSDFH